MSETRIALNNNLVDNGYTFFWSGRVKEKKSEVGFAITNTIMPYLGQEPTAISDQIKIMRLSLKKNHYVTMTNPEEKKKEFYNKLREMVKHISISDKLIIAGDFNVRVRHY